MPRKRKQQPKPQTETPPLTLDPVAETVSPDTPPETQQEPVAETVSPHKLMSTAHLMIPVAAPPDDDGYPGRKHIDMHLTRPQRDMLRRIMDGLIQERAITDSGRVVDGPHAALRWILEEVSRQTSKGG